MGKKNKRRKLLNERADDKFYIIFDTEADEDFDDEPGCGVINGREERKFMKKPTIKSIEVVWALGFKVVR